jgi:hypothetical protein
MEWAGKETARAMRQSLWLATSRRAARNETDLRRVGFVFPGIAMHVELQVLR